MIAGAECAGAGVGSFVQALIVNIDAQHSDKLSMLRALARARSTIRMNAPLHPLQATYAAQRRAGQLAAAADTLKAVLKADPRADWAYNELTELLHTMGRKGDAETLARMALRVNPLNAHAHALFGTLLSEMNDLPSGEQHFRRALALGGDDARVLANLALNLMQQGRAAEAEEFFAKADGLAPNNLRTLAHWSKLAEVRGDLPRALELLQRAASAASSADVDLLHANHLARTGRPAEALALLDRAPQLNGDARLERGRLLDRLGRFDEAWRDMVAGKQQLAAQSGLTYNAQAVEAFFGRLKRFFVRANNMLLPRAAVRSDVPQPIFVIGFPRSGTTLIEQVLSSHSAVRAGGELTFIGELRDLALRQFPGPESFPDNLSQMWTADRRWAATAFRDYYFARAEQYGLTGVGAQFFTDKMPFNEMWLPLIHTAFPHAKIVRVVRHPLDVCVSMLANNLTHGFNCGYSIEGIVHHLLAIADLEAHYMREWPAEVFELRYEQFVAEQQYETTRLFDFLGLSVEPACLKFHENPRYAPTPSYAQVTERLNDRSIGRHQRYAQQLEPYARQLAPLIEARGYAPRA